MQNLNYLFNKAYYRNLGNPNFERDVKEINHKIEHTQFDESDYRPSPFDCQTIVMKIGYPGLIIGMGNSHGVGTKDFKWKDDIKADKESNKIFIVGNLREIFRKFFDGEKFDNAIKDAAKNGASVNIVRNQIEFVRNSLKQGELNDMSIFDGSLMKAEKFVKKIVDMCISGNEEIKTGFSFDYTTGQPYIPASSVKGMLRSYFKEHRQAVSEIIKAKTDEVFSQDEIALLESDIFDYNDIFLDAVVYLGDKYGYMLSSDYITPHDTDHIKNPVPIRILKINPGVRLEFRFLLNGHTVNDKTVTKDMLKDIFTELLSLFGVGAKTNVGYGIMQPNADRPAYEPEPVYTAPQPSRQPQNNSGNRQHSGNYRNNGNNTRNQNTPAPAASAPIKIKCPHCGERTYKYQQDGKTLNTECKKCRKPLNLGE